MSYTDHCFYETSIALALYDMNQIIAKLLRSNELKRTDPHTLLTNTNLSDIAIKRYQDLFEPYHLNFN